MSWQPESTRWQQDRPGGTGTGVEEGAGALVRPVLLGLAAGLGVALAGLVVVGVVVLGISGSAGNGVLLVLAAGLGVPLLALAASLGAGLAGRRAATLRPGLARRVALGTGAAVGVVALALGIAPGLRWLTLPLYLAGVAAGTLLGARRAVPGR